MIKFFRLLVLMAVFSFSNNYAQEELNPNLQNILSGLKSQDYNDRSIAFDTLKSLENKELVIVLTKMLSEIDPWTAPLKGGEPLASHRGLIERYIFLLSEFDIEASEMDLSDSSSRKVIIGRLSGKEIQTNSSLQDLSGKNPEVQKRSKNSLKPESLPNENIVQSTEKGDWGKNPSPSENGVIEEKRITESKEISNRLPWIIAGVLLLGSLLLLLKIFKGKSTS